MGVFYVPVGNDGKESAARPRHYRHSRILSFNRAARPPLLTRIHLVFVSLPCSHFILSPFRSLPLVVLPFFLHLSRGHTFSLIFATTTAHGPLVDRPRGPAPRVVFVRCAPSPVFAYILLVLNGAGASAPYVLRLSRLYLDTLLPCSVSSRLYPVSRIVLSRISISSLFTSLFPHFTPSSLALFVFKRYLLK